MLDRVTLDQLRILLAVANSGSFSAAARQLGRVQSAVSQSIQALENGLGIVLFDRSSKTPVLNDAGLAILDDARHLLRETERLKARAAAIASDIEPELTLAVDTLFPGEVMMASLKDLSQAFPELPVALFTEGLGAAEQRLKDGVARLGIYFPLAPTLADFEVQPLADIPMVPVVATTHPLASRPGPISDDALRAEVQLVLTDRSPNTYGTGGGVISRQIWRFADMASRHDYLLAGFGWCNMPEHLVRKDLAAGRLKRLERTNHNTWIVPLHLVHERGRTPGRAGRWLIENLKSRLAICLGDKAAA